MKWKVAKNTISELLVNGENMIYPWGIETADSYAFFSLEDGLGYRYKVLEQEKKTTDNRFYQRIVVEMREGKWELIRRKATLTCLEDSVAMDFVMRFRFRKKFFEKALIAGEIFSHKNTNIYYQYPVKEAALIGDTYSVKIEAEKAECSEKMRPHMYVRDAENEWVVHARMLPSTADKQVIKLCNPWALSYPLPQFISKPILSIPFIKKELWYRGERQHYTNRIVRRINPMAYPLVRMPKGTKLNWEVTVSLHGNG